MSPLALFLRALVVAYQWTLSPLIGPTCRFEPSCSHYALEALARHGALRGGWLALRRLARCHPWGGAGFDPVPEVRSAVAPAALGKPVSHQHFKRSLPARPPGTIPTP
jgi:putative membrane protein insertion efficiency factor